MSKIVDKTDRRPIYKELGIETLQEHMIYIRKDSEICISEGFEALTRVLVSNGDRSLVASIQMVTSGKLLKIGEVGLSNASAKLLQVKEGDQLVINHLSSIDSFRHVRSKIYGNPLDQKSLTNIIQDIIKGRYAAVHLSAFITACAGDSLSTDEIISLTRAMVNAGDRLKWNREIIADKHCVGGLPGNRTTPIVVSIVAAAGLLIPKTSSRAITSPAGTADTMSVMTRVKLELDEIRKIVNEYNGCMVSGENHLSPADDTLIRIERALDIDSEGQMIASVLSKKAAAGSTHLIIDIPVGPTAKVRSESDAERLKYYFKVVGKEMGFVLKIVITDGLQPIGRGIGPALEARDVLSVLRNEADAPQDSKEKSIMLAGELLELAGHSLNGQGARLAGRILESGEALERFMDICKAQGGFTEPGIAKYTKNIYADYSGMITAIDNRKIAKIAKLAGAPSDPEAGVWFNAPLGRKVSKGDLLYVIHAQSQGELDYAMNYLKTENHVISIK